MDSRLVVIRLLVSFMALIVSHRCFFFISSFPLLLDNHLTTCPQVDGRF